MEEPITTKKQLEDLIKQLDTEILETENQQEHTEQENTSAIELTEKAIHDVLDALGWD